MPNLWTLEYAPHQQKTDIFPNLSAYITSQRAKRITIENGKIEGLS